MEQIKEEKGSITPMKDIVRPLLEQDESHFFEPLNSRKIFCDGFSLPSHPFKTLSEAQNFLLTHGVNVNMPTKSAKEG